MTETLWSDLTPEQQYHIWSLYCESGSFGVPLGYTDYSNYCDLLDSWYPFPVREDWVAQL